MLSPQLPRWNIFARELEDILAAHHLRLGHLDDLGVVEHREIVRRLQHSLRTPTHFPTLNPEEIDRLFATVPLEDVEKIRIRAALLTTAVERILMDRIDAQTAFMAANDVFNILIAAMHAQPDNVLAGVRGGAPTESAEQIGDAVFEEALDLVDRATLVLHLSQQASTAEARRGHAQSACYGFAQALALLQQMPLPHRESGEWNAWDYEARNGHLLAESLMKNDVERGQP